MACNPGKEQIERNKDVRITTGSAPKEEKVDYQAEEFLARAIRAEKRERELSKACADARMALGAIIDASGLFPAPCTVFEDNGIVMITIPGSKPRQIGQHIDFVVGHLERGKESAKEDLPEADDSESAPLELQKQVTQIAEQLSDLGYQVGLNVGDIIILKRRMDAWECPKGSEEKDSA